jgi:glycerol-3-phosphate dehydrogenase
MSAFLTEGSRVVGIQARDDLTAEDFSILGDQVVTCTGDASTDMKNLHVPEPVFGQMRFAKAVNVVVSRPAARRALALQASGDNGRGEDQRLLFFVPWQDKTMIGTWYFQCSAQARNRQLRGEEIEQILSDVNAAYPELAVSADDITFVHLGRLPSWPDNSNNNEPRLLAHGRIIDHGRHSGWEGLWSVVGVKYTTARATAEKVLYRIFGKRFRGSGHRLNAGQPKTISGETVVPRLGRSSADLIENYTREARAHLWATFGDRTPEVVAWAGDNPSMFAPVPGSDACPQVALNYSIQHESVWYLTDLLLRRSNLGAAAPPPPETVNWAAEQMGHHLNWDQARKQREIDRMNTHYNWLKSNQ